MGTLHGRIAGIPLPVSRLILGTAPFGDRTFALFPAPRRSELFFQLLDAVWEQGCNAFDAAAVYQLGGSERLLGAWTKSRGNREQAVLITKGAHPSIPLFRSRIGSRAIVEDLEGSLRRLRTDYVDLYLLHRDDLSVPVGPLVETLHRLREQGKIRAYGGSNWGWERVAEANSYAAEHGLTPFAASSPHFSLAEWRRPPYPGCVSVAGAAGAASRAWYGHAGVAVLAWSSLSKGYFGVSTAACRAAGQVARIRRRGQPGAVRPGARDGAQARCLPRPRWPWHTFSRNRWRRFAIVSTHSAARFRENCGSSPVVIVFGGGTMAGAGRRSVSNGNGNQAAAREEAADVIVVGSGAAGGWAAKELSEAGLCVLLLEAGPARSPAAAGCQGLELMIKRLYRMARGRQPVQSFHPIYWAKNPDLFVDDVEEPYIAPADQPFNWIRGRQLGGRTLLWGGLTLRLSDYELQSKSTRGFRPGLADPLRRPCPVLRQGGATFSASTATMTACRAAGWQIPGVAAAHRGRGGLPP